MAKNVYCPVCGFKFVDIDDFIPKHNRNPRRLSNNQKVDLCYGSYSPIIGSNIFEVSKLAQSKCGVFDDDEADEADDFLYGNYANEVADAPPPNDLLNEVDGLF